MHELTTNPDDESRTPKPSAAEVAARLDRLWFVAAGSPTENRLQESGHYVGTYRIERAIGSGGFGVVYLARDERLKRDVAVKIPRPEILADSEKLNRFRDEATIAASLEHPGIVPVYEANLDATPPFIASAFCHGPDLQQWLEKNSQPISPQDATTLILKIAVAMIYAHKRGVIHRDLKPANIMLISMDGETRCHQSLGQYEPRLTDFGLAKVIQDVLHNTRSSMLLGSPLYMSPEQAFCRNDEIGTATDIFGMGAILYHLLTGVPPFAADSYPGVLLRLNEDSPYSIVKQNSLVDRDLETVCLKCLEKSPDDRFQNVHELVEELQRCLDDQPIRCAPASSVERMGRWSRDRRRIFETMFAVMTISVIRTIFAWLGIGLVTISDSTVTLGEIGQATLNHLLFTTPLDLLIAYAAWRNVHQKMSRTVYWLTFWLLSISGIAILLVALNALPPPIWYERNPSARIMTLALIATTFAAQAICWLLGDWCRVRSRNSNSHLDR